MSIWRATSLSETPHIVMSSWQVYEIFSEHYGERTRHLIGYNETEHEGRVSSKIVSYDPLTKIAVTHSGRRYQLMGPSGYDSDAAYVWANWSESLDACDVVNVSAEYY